MSETSNKIRRRASRYAEAMWGPVWDAHLSAAEVSMRLAQAGRAMDEADAEIEDKADAIREHYAARVAKASRRAELAEAKVRSVQTLARYWSLGPCANRDTMTNAVAASRLMAHLGMDSDS